MSTYDEERLGELLRMLRPAPAGWLEAAQELPAARRVLEDIVARAEADAAYRKTVIADLEAALEREGVDVDPRLVDELRRNLSET
jgi:hypothetical protein